MTYIIIQVLLFLFGSALLVVDNSGGYIDNMTIVSVFGIIIILLSISLQFVVGGLVSLFKKIFKK